MYLTFWAVGRGRVVDCPDAVAALQPVVQARKQRASGGDKEQADGAAQVYVPLIGLAPPSLTECALPNAVRPFARKPALT